MPRNSIFIRSALVAAFVLLFSVGAVFSADNRYALVIGNGIYQDRSISALTNPVNDATDMAAVLKEIGYDVTLKTNIGLRDMMTAVEDFSFNLRRSPDSEGFFWFAGHGLSVRGIHYMLPVDVDPANDNIIARGSYSVDDLMEEIGNARNKTNLIVIDACRNTLLPGGGSRAVGTRGLAVLAADDYRVAGNKVVYSTMAGRTAADGVPGSRNSPFAQAFITNIKNPESFDDVFLDIANETMRLTRGDQQPYAMGSFAVKSYALNPLPPAPPPAATAVAPTETAAPIIIIQEVPVARPRAEPTVFTLDGKKVMSVSGAPSFSGYTAGNELGGAQAALSFGVGLTFTFYEHYGDYGEFFFIPNSFFVSAEYVNDTRQIKADKMPMTVNQGQLNVSGFAWSLGTQWKIRLGGTQRNILRFGPSLVFFTVNENIYLTDSALFTDKRRGIWSDNLNFTPGFGISAGFSFRLTQLISLDFGLAYKMAFPQEKAVRFQWYDNLLVHHDELFTGESTSPYFTSGNLGVTFWWPR